MKFNKLNSISAPGDEKFVCFEYCNDNGGDGEGGIDTIFLGSGSGKVYVYPIHKIVFARNLRPEAISAESPHGGSVTCMLYIPPTYCNHMCMSDAASDSSASGGDVTSLNLDRVRGKKQHQTGSSSVTHGGDHRDPHLLVTGGLDRTIKVWMPRSKNGSHYIQTLYGHDGKISCLTNGFDGSFLSCASDGMLKIWSPQRGRQLMRLPFFECTFTLNSSSRCWLTSMLVNHIGVWTCVVGDSSGCIEVYRKSLQGGINSSGQRGNNESKVASFNGAMLRYKRWEKMHTLGVVQIVLAHDEKFVISLSSDGSAKIIDILLGAIFFAIDNPRKCIYTGVMWVPSKMQFCLSDELGHVELWSLLLERKVNESSLVVCGDKAMAKSITSTHRGPLLTTLAAHKDTGNFLAIHPRIGDVVLWKMVEETTCIQYLDRESRDTCMVVNFGLIPTAKRNSSSGACTNPASTTATTATPSEVIVGSVASILHAVQQGQKIQAQTTALSSATQKKMALEHCQANRSVMFDDRHTEINVDVNMTHHVAPESNKHHVQHETLLCDESSFFSVDEEGICRCWDEYDKTERYTFRAKGPQVSCVKFVWSMNCLAVGHRNGQISFWNLDSGLRFTSCKPLQAVSCMEIAKAKNCDVLVVTDFSGKMHMLNLALFKVNPLQISIDATFAGYHDPEEPAILCMAYHESTGVIFSGGDDRSIRYWRLPKDIDYKTARSGPGQHHPGAVCCLVTTDHLLISGDEEGRVNVWVIGGDGSDGDGNRGGGSCRSRDGRLNSEEGGHGLADTFSALNTTESTGVDEIGTHTAGGVTMSGLDEAQSTSPSRGRVGSDGTITGTGSGRHSTLPALHLVGSWNLGSYAAIRSISAQEVSGGVYICYITRLNKTSIRFLSFIHHLTFPVEPASQGTAFVQFAIPSPVSTTTSVGPRTSHSFPQADSNVSSDSSSPIQPRRRSTSLDVNCTTEKGDYSSSHSTAHSTSHTPITTPQLVPESILLAATRWNGLTGAEIIDAGGVLRTVGVSTSVDDSGTGAELAEEADCSNKEFVSVPAYLFVHCSDIDEFQSTAQGKEPSTVCLQCDEEKNLCYTFVGSENGSVYKYTSEMIQLLAT